MPISPRQKKYHVTPNSRGLQPISVPFPSFGLVYSEDSPFHNIDTVYIRYMTPIEEDILLSETFYKDNTLISNLIVSALVYPKATFEQVEELVVGDKEAILLALRVTGYGQLLQFPIDCPSCEAKSEIVIDLGSTQIQELGGEYGPESCGLVEAGKNLFCCKLPLSQKTVYFSLPTKIDIVRIGRDEPDTLPVPKVLRTVFQNVVAVDDITDRNVMAKILSNLRTKDSATLRLFFNAIRPYVDINYPYQCEKCGYKEPLWFPCDNTIFHIQPKDRKIVWLEPAFILGYYYGMSWETYLEYPVFLRKQLIERINEEIKAANERNSDITTKAPHDNTAEVRQLSGKTNQNFTNPKMQRFT